MTPLSSIIAEKCSVDSLDVVHALTFGTGETCTIEQCKEIARAYAKEVAEMALHQAVYNYRYIKMKDDAGMSHDIYSSVIKTEIHLP